MVNQTGNKKAGTNAIKKSSVRHIGEKRGEKCGETLSLRLLLTLPSNSTSKSIINNS